MRTMEDCSDDAIDYVHSAMVRVVYEYMERGKGRSIERVERGVGLNVAGTKCVEWTGWVDVQIRRRTVLLV